MWIRQKNNTNIENSNIELNIIMAQVQKQRRTIKIIIKTEIENRKISIYLKVIRIVIRKGVVRIGVIVRIEVVNMKEKKNRKEINNNNHQLKWN